MNGRSITTITRFLTLVRTLVYRVLGICRLSAQPYEAAALHTFDIFIGVAQDAVLSWTQANRTRAVMQLRSF